MLPSRLHLVLVFYIARRPYSWMPITSMPFTIIPRRIQRPYSKHALHRYTDLPLCGLTLEGTESEPPHLTPRAGSSAWVMIRTIFRYKRTKRSVLLSCRLLPYTRLSIRASTLFTRSRSIGTVRRWSLTLVSPDEQHCQQKRTCDHYHPSLYQHSEPPPCRIACSRFSISSRRGRLPPHFAKGL